MNTSTTVTIVRFKDLSGRQSLIVLASSDNDKELPTAKEVIQACEQVYGQSNVEVYSRRLNKVPNELLDAIETQRSLDKIRRGANE